jgi:hypothetical protein
MQISPSANLFRALGGLSQTGPGQAASRPAAAQQPATVQQQAARPRVPADTAAAAAPHLASLRTQPQQTAAQPAPNMPRGSLINLKI